MKKKLIALGLALGMIVSMSACGSGSKDASSADAGSASASNEPAVELHVSAAASMTESFLHMILQAHSLLRSLAALTAIYLSQLLRSR